MESSCRTKLKLTTSNVTGTNVFSTKPLWRIQYIKSRLQNCTDMQMRHCKRGGEPITCSNPTPPVRVCLKLLSIFSASGSGQRYLIPVKRPPKGSTLGPFWISLLLQCLFKPHTDFQKRAKTDLMSSSWHLRNICAVKTYLDGPRSLWIFGSRNILPKKKAWKH